MTVEIGHLSLMLALPVALAGGGLTLAGSLCQRPQWLRFTLPSVALLLLLLAAAYASLTCAFIVQDFSLLLVVAHSDSNLALPYRLSAVWSGHQGSMLLWVFMLCGWTLCLSCFSRPWTERLKAHTIAVLLLLIAGLLFHLCLNSDPFERLPVVAANGRGLNPMLQDPSMALHPPLLFLGLSGLAIPYAFAIAMLLHRRPEPEAWRHLRPWLTPACASLTLGIALGAWWAYGEPGWGGWWFWDPVENVSLICWLAAIALLHALAPGTGRLNNSFNRLTTFLALLPWPLALLGAFLVRSGVLGSIHAFTAEPGKGISLLILLVLTAGCALLLFCLIRTPGARQGSPCLRLREIPLPTAILLLLTACGTVLLGTLYPLLMETLGLGRISVGPPYFNRMFALLMVPAAIFMFVAVFLPPSDALKTRCRLPSSLAHAGILLLAVGALLSQHGSVQREIRMAPGETVTIAGHTLRFVKLQPLSDSNYLAIRGHFAWSANGQNGQLQPEKRRYRTSLLWMTETAIDRNFWRDLHISLGEPVRHDQPFGAWVVRFHKRPMMICVWLGFLLMVLGKVSTWLQRRKSTLVETHEEGGAG